MKEGNHKNGTKENNAFFCVRVRWGACVSWDLGGGGVGGDDGALIWLLFT